MPGETAREREWLSGEAPEMPPAFLLDLGERLVAAAPITARTRVLDVTTGAGTAAVAAALRGGEVTATDPAPEMLAAGDRHARAAGVRILWVEADAHALPFADASFDVVMSAEGVMFTPDQARAAGELARVCRPGGTIALLSWTPAGMLGALAEGPAAWGDPDHLRELFGESVDFRHLEFDRQDVTAFHSPDEFAELLLHHHGPTLAERAEAASAEAFDVALRCFCEEWEHDGHFELEYLVARGTRR